MYAKTTGENVVLIEIEEQIFSRDDCTFTLTGDIKGGIPTPALPPFSIPKHSVENGTLPPEDVSFGDMAGNLGSAFIIIPIIAILESVAIAKAFCKAPFC